MSRFTVKVRTAEGTIAYDAIGTSSIDIHLAALDIFGLCGVTVRPI